MSTDLTGEQMQAKITAARREAEGLKDRIKRKKDDLADTSCKYTQFYVAAPNAHLKAATAMVDC